MADMKQGTSTPFDLSLNNKGIRLSLGRGGSSLDLRVQWRDVPRLVRALRRRWVLITTFLSVVGGLSVDAVRPMIAAGLRAVAEWVAGRAVSDLAMWPWSDLEKASMPEPGTLLEPGVPRI